MSVQEGVSKPLRLFSGSGQGWDLYQCPVDVKISLAADWAVGGGVGLFNNSGSLRSLGLALRMAAELRGNREGVDDVSYDLGGQ